MRSIGIRLHAQVVGVRLTDEHDEAIADYVCRALERVEAPPTPAITIERHDTFELAAEALMRDLVNELVTPYAAGLAVHGAAVARDGRAIVFPAVSGSGKSTLSVHLAAEGGGFLTDELIFIPTGESRVHALPRPAHLKPGSVFLLEQHPTLPARRYAHGALVELAVETRTMPLLGFVFIERDPQATPLLEPLPPAQASYELMKSVVNARNLPAVGVPEAARVCRGGKSYRMRYRDASEASAMLATIAERG